MSRAPLIVATAWMLLSLLTPAASQAQQRRYQPATPTVSPYLNLLRNNPGPIPNYYSLVRPELDQLQFNRQQIAQQAKQAATLRFLENQTQQTAPVSPTGKSSWFMTTGKSSYMNTSRFYSRTPTGARR